MTFQSAFLANLASGLVEGSFVALTSVSVALVVRRRRQRDLGALKVEPFRVMSWKCPGCGCRMEPAGLVEVPGREEKESEDAA